MKFNIIQEISKPDNFDTEVHRKVNKAYKEFRKLQASFAASREYIQPNN